MCKTKINETKRNEMFLNIHKSLNTCSTARHISYMPIRQTNYSAYPSRLNEFVLKMNRFHNTIMNLFHISMHQTKQNKNISSVYERRTISITKFLYYCTEYILY